MKKFILSFLILFSCLQADNIAVVTSTSGDISFIDMDTLTKGITLSTGFSGTTDIAITSDNKKVVACYQGSDAIVVIDLTTFAYTTINLPAGSGPVAIAITPDNTKAFVVNASINPGTVSVIDLTATPFLSTTITLSGFAFPIGQAFPGDKIIVITPDGKTVFVSQFVNSVVSPIDVDSLTPLPDITTALNPDFLAFTPDYKYLLASCYNGGVVTRIDVQTLSAVGNIPVGVVPDGIIIDTSRNMAYVINIGSQSVTPIDLSTFTPLTSFNVGGFAPSHGIITPDFNTLLISDYSGNLVDPVDISGPAPVVLAPIPVGASPINFAIASGKALVLFLSPTTFVTPIDLATLNPLPNIADGTGPMQAVIFAGITNNITSPQNFSAKREVGNGLFQKDLINVLSWKQPVTGTPAFYKIYRDSALTDLVATICGTQTIYYDHNRKNGVVYTYFIVAGDGSGNISIPVSLSFP